jgi:putative drug exporter of the RND superfamily
VSTLLYRLSRAAFRRARTVLVIWLLAAMALLGVGFGLGGSTDDTFTIPGTESQEALDELGELFPQVAGTTVQVVVVAPDGQRVDDPRVRAEIADIAADVAGVDGVDQVLGPFDPFADNQVSDDGTVAIIQATLIGQQAEVSDATLDAVVATGEGRDARVEFAGQIFADQVPGISIIEAIGVGIAGIVLLITFGSLRSAGMPIVSALLGVGVSMGGIFFVASLVPVSSAAPLLALMIGLAVGIDYALFILSRHRTQLATGMQPYESAGVAAGTAGSAVVFAGGTVIIALSGLLVVGIPFLSIMGIGGAVAVAVAVVAALTLLPALMGLAGDRLIPREGSRAWRRAHPVAGGGPTMGRRWVRGVMRRPWLTTLSVVTVLGAVSLPAFALDLNLPDGGKEPAGTTQREAYDIIADSFGPGTAGPLLVTVDITQTTEVLEDLDAIRGELQALPGVANVSRGIPSPGVERAIFRVAPETAPDAAETKTVVADIRALGVELDARYGTPIAVTGVTAIGIDISQRLSGALVPFALIVVGLSIVLLMAVFRSVLVPIKAALGFLLSVGTALGVTVVVFQWGYGAELLHVEPGPILSFMPIILMAVLFGLAMDYEVFLVSGMREQHVHGAGPREAIEEGFTTGARVVTAAALIMFLVFAAFVPEGLALIKPVALGLAVGIAVDAFIVRMTLGPALMTLFGRAGWWFPRSLDRALPNLDIEGEALGAHRDTEEWAAAHGGSTLVVDGLRARGVDGVLDADVPAGSRLALAVDPAARRPLLAALAGYVPVVAGRARVADALLPSQPGRVARRVTLVDLEPSRLPASASVATLADERLTAARARRGVEAWWKSLAGRLRTADEPQLARGLERIDVAKPLAALDTRERALVAAALGSIDGAPVVLVDCGSLPFDTVADADRVLAVIAPTTARVLVGHHVPSLPADGRATGRLRADQPTANILDPEAIPS